eukprot:CAMPEP_0170469304 /NCGR_PEP_ID=MMETSP0123-20130129/12174_1 /TAXON_ID=182087 /ORGANISM="Favella ehrenbergii, Strain Fehren 1" /LENGTH=143 /DNA_ID=CAMNT_0010736119 /DNA_START=9 /DNA_END=440 /DNA_ORIENTATION=+
MCLDWLFNMQIPESTDSIVVIRPSAKTFVNGIASTYDEEYDARLKGRVSEFEFTDMIEKLNDQLSSMFPCNLCWVLGYVLCPFSLGLSLLIPYQCIKDAEESLLHRINRNNRKLLLSRGVEMVLVKRRGTSWIELRIGEQTEE